MNDLQKRLMEIWKICFGDSDEFIRFFFQAKYREDQVLFREENGKIITALHMLPYSMTWQNTVIPVSYIAGACTLPDMRDRGLMKNLLLASFKHMREKHVPATVLIPAEKWLFDYYAQSGYASVFGYTPVSCPQTTPTSPAGEIPVYEIPFRQVLHHENDRFPATEEIYRYFDFKMHERPCCIQHSYPDFIANLTELYAAGGKIYIALSPEHTVTGLAWVVPEPSRLLVKEIICDEEVIRTTLVREIAKTGPDKKIVCKLYPPQSPFVPYGMARIVDAPHMLTLFAADHPDLTFTLELTDPQLPENTGLYRIENGTCENQHTSPQEPFYKLDIRQLTQALFGCPPYKPGLPESIFPVQHPWMNLMLD